MNMKTLVENSLPRPATVASREESRTERLIRYAFDFFQLIIYIRQPLREALFVFIFVLFGINSLRILLISWKSIMYRYLGT